MSDQQKSSPDSQESGSHPIWSFSGLSEEELHEILSDPQHEQFDRLAARLLESSVEPDVVFDYLDRDVLVKHYGRIKKAFGQGAGAKKNRRFWERMVQQARDRSPDQGSDEELAAPENKDEGDRAVSNSARDIGRRIREIRLKQGLSQAELGERLGVSRQVISQLESGQSNPSFERVQRVLHALGFKAHLKVKSL